MCLRKIWLFDFGERYDGVFIIITVEAMGDRNAKVVFDFQ